MDYQRSWETFNTYNSLLLNIPQTPTSSLFPAVQIFLRLTIFKPKHRLTFLAIPPFNLWLELANSLVTSTGITVFKGLLPANDKYPLDHTFLALNINDDKDFWLFVFTDLHCRVSYGFDLCTLGRKTQKHGFSKWHPFQQFMIIHSIYRPLQMLSSWIVFSPQKAVTAFVLMNKKVGVLMARTWPGQIANK